MYFGERERENLPRKSSKNPKILFFFFPWGVWGYLCSKYNPLASGGPLGCTKLVANVSNFDFSNSDFDCTFEGPSKL